MGSRLYVGNLPFTADESAVRLLFEGNDRKVEEVKLITDRETGRPRGFGFVEMGSHEHAEQAVRELNGHSLDGRAGMLDCSENCELLGLCIRGRYRI